MARLGTKRVAFFFLNGKRYSIDKLTEIISGFNYEVQYTITENTANGLTYNITASDSVITRDGNTVIIGG